MDLISNLIDEQSTSALAYTLLHSLWQGLLVALLMSLVIDKFKNSVNKYMLAVASLLAIVLLSVGTFLHYLDLENTSQLVTTITSPSSAVAIDTSSLIASTSDFLSENSQVILVIWLSGVMLFSAKLLFSLGYIQYLKQGQEHPTLQYALTKMQKLLNIKSELSVMESARVNVPVVVGYFKPVILFPLGVINQLTMEEIDGILAHELAHIKRHDYLVNIFQTVIEIAFYFNPAVWYVNATIRAEREKCCDDAVLRAGVDPIIYAKSLLKLKELQTLHTPDLALAFANDRSTLIHRVKHILNMSQTKSNMKEKSVATILIMVFAVLFSTNALIGEKSNFKTNMLSASLTPSVEKISEMRDENAHISPLSSTRLDTLPQTQNRISIQTQKNGKSMSLTKENGKITEMKIDGRLIPESEYDDHKDLTDDVIILDRGNGSFWMQGGDGESIFPQRFDFGEFFDQGKMNEMFEGLEQFEDGFAFPDMEKLEMDEEQLQEFEKRMQEFGQNFQLEFDNEGFGNMEMWLDGLDENMKHFRIDTMIHMGPNGFQDFRLHLDGDNISRWTERENSNGNAPRWTDRGITRGNVSDMLGRELNRDGLLEPYKQNKVTLTGKYLKINGDKQPKNIWGKYKRIYEDNTGMQLTKKARLDFEVEGKKSNRKIRSF